MEKVIVTGGAGFIGSSIVKKLVNKGRYEIIVPLKNCDPWRLRRIISQIKTVNCDLTDISAVDTLIGDLKPEYILHLATKGVYPREWDDRMGILKGNYEMSVNLLESVYKHHSKKMFLRHFINTGSVFEYGTKKGKVNEDDVIFDDNLNEYSALKKVTTTLTLTYKDYFPVTVIRPFTAYGPYGDKERFIESSINKALKNEPIRIVEGVVRDFVFVEDIAGLFVSAMGKKKVFGEVLNVGSGKHVTLEETAKLIIELTKSKSKIIKDDKYKRKKDSRCWADITRVIKMVNWQPQYTLRQGLKRTLNWYKQFEFNSSN